MFKKSDLEKLKKKDLVEAVLDIQKERMAILGEGECFIRKTPSGFAQSVKVNVNLYESKKHIYSLGDKWKISVDGYDHINQVAGLTLMSPETIRLGTDKVGNPHIEISPKRRVLAVTVRRVIIGAAPSGGLVVVERLLRLDLGLYFLEDLQRKVKNRAGAGGYGTDIIKPASATGINNTLVPFEVGPAILWVDMNHVDIQEAFSEDTRRCKYSERIATRICERNAMASHPAIAVRNVNPVNGVATVPIFGGKKIVDEETVRKIAKAFSEDEQSKLIDVEVLSSGVVEQPSFEEVVQVDEGDEKEKV